MQMLRMLPHFGLVSLFIIWFGVGETPKIVLIAMGATFPLYLNTFGGIRGIERKVVEAARSMHLSQAQRIRHVIIPGALPQTLVGLRQSLGIAWLSLIVAELIAAQTGLGRSSTTPASSSRPTSSSSDSWSTHSSASRPTPSSASSRGRPWHGGPDP